MGESSGSWLEHRVGLRPVVLFLVLSVGSVALGAAVMVGLHVTGDRFWAVCAVLGLNGALFGGISAAVTSGDSYVGVDR